MGIQRYFRSPLRRALKSGAGIHPYASDPDPPVSRRPKGKYKSTYFIRTRGKMTDAPIGVATVRRLVRNGRVVAHPTEYHAGRHGIGFQECVTALEHCYAIQPDDRHPGSWYALASHTYGRTLRVDFDAHHGPDGMLILVVTAYHVRP